MASGSVLKKIEERIKAGRPGRIHCGEGLYFWLKDARNHYWTYRYMTAGKAREVVLGRFEDGKSNAARKALSLSDAKTKRNELSAMRTQGVDPVEHNRRLKGQSDATTFEAYALAYIDEHRPRWKNAKHAAQWESTLRQYAFPKLGKLPLDKIGTAHVLDVLKPIWKDKPETAARLRGRIESILAAATVEERRSGDNPARWRGHLDKRLAPRAELKPVKHHAALPYSDMPAFMARLQKQVGNGALALRLAILTAARTGEVIYAKRGEFDLNAALWTIPAARMKMKREHRVPLSSEAVKAIQQAMDENPVRPGRDPAKSFLFRGANLDKPLSNMAMLATLKRMTAEEEKATGKTPDGITAHGFRSTFRDWAAEQTAFPNHVIEMALAHAIGDKVEAAYRRGDLLEKRKQLMEAWARYCLTPAAKRVNVTPLRKSASQRPAT